MLTMPNFKKSLIVEQFQGNYLKVHALPAPLNLPCRLVFHVNVPKQSAKWHSNTDTTGMEGEIKWPIFY